MRVRCQGLNREMADFTALLNLNQENQNNEEKLELVRMFVEFLESDKHGHGHKMHKHGHGHRGMFGHFEKHGPGRHHGRHNLYGRHGNHHGHHGSHHHGPHHCGLLHHGPHHHGPHHRGPHHHGSHGYDHRRRGCHDHDGKFKAHWIIDLTDTDQENDTQCIDEIDCNTSPANQKGTSTSDGQKQPAVVNRPNCCCSRYGRRHFGRSGRWTPCPYKRNNNTSNDNSGQTGEPMNEENVEEAQETITTMVENINIATTV